MTQAAGTRAPKRAPRAPVAVAEQPAPSRTDLDRRLRIAIAVLAVIGIGVATYLTYVHYAKLKIACTNTGCTTVQSSVYAKLAGIPVPVLGLVGYVSILASILVLRGEVSRIVSFGLALTGFLFSLYLTYREIFTIKAICEWCVSSAVLMTLLAVITAVRVVRGEPLGP